MPYLWLLISHHEPGTVRSRTSDAVRAVRRYSAMAVVSVIVLVAAGVTMAWVYTQSWSAVYGTAYGVVLVAKSIMLAVVLVLGAGNFLLIRGQRFNSSPWLLRIGQFSEAEIGIGFTIILAAASLTAQPPAVDLVQNRLTLPEISARMTPQWPQFFNSLCSGFTAGAVDEGSHPDICSVARRCQRPPITRWSRSGRTITIIGPGSLF